LTSEASSETAYASRYGIVEYLTDAVFVLQYIRPDDFRETRMAIEIQKIRDANHSREKKPYEITSEGISVYQQANLFCSGRFGAGFSQCYSSHCKSLHA